jgi:threonine/homoserine/homoserine lactone efflux protein
MSSHQLIYFLSAALLLAAAPGPDNLGVLALGLSQGRRASLGFAWGCAAGCLNHTLLAVIGVSALIRTSPVAFTLLQWAGAAYLAWIGWQSLRNLAQAQGAVSQNTNQSAHFLPQFRRGLIANAINPKVALFFLALLPQFVEAGGWSTPAQLAVLGILFSLISGLIFGMLALCSGSIGAWLTRRPGAFKLLQGATGVLFIGLAIRLLCASANTQPQH